MTEDIEKGFMASHLISKLSKQTKIRGKDYFKQFKK